MNMPDLANLLHEYQQYSPENAEQQQIKSQIITYLSLCYWWRSPYITNLFPETIQQIQGELQQQITHKLHTYLNQTSNPKKLAEILLKESLILQKQYQQKLITDKFINTLAMATKNTPPDSFQRKQLMQILIKAMETKNTYKKQGLGPNLNLYPQDYQDAFAEAKGESIRYALAKIDQYDEQQGDFMALINYWIPRKFLDAASKILGLKKNQVNKSEKDKIQIVIQDHNTLTEYLHQNIQPEFYNYEKSQEIKNLILQDPNNKLAKPIRKDRTDITFKDVLIAIHWEEESFTNLSQKWQIPYTTLKSFYNRELQQVKADLVDYLQ
ncbi:hypothetical protein [Nodularia chucula]|uniref:hypothetical protein n=1 Tax=Nodularia chucula TaxID=3093667 RepID=UPI0039C6D73B